MATYTTALVVGDREDLSDIIYNIAPTDTPFMMLAGRGTASNVTHEWQTDSLAAPASNAQAEGDDLTDTTPTKTVRLNNQTQISAKSVVISGTLESVDKAGRKSELAYQVAKYGKEIKRDIETHASGNFPQATGTTRKAASLAAWQVAALDTAGAEGNSSFGAGSTGASVKSANNFQPIVNATTGDAYEDGTQRPLTESLLKTLLQNCWKHGGEPSVVLCGPFNKTVISSFTGNSTRFDQGEDKRLVAAIDVYVSDFGTMRITPSRFSPERTVYALTPKMWSIDYLRSFRQHPLAKTGDAEKRWLGAEWTLRANETRSSGAVFDVTTA